MPEICFAYLGQKLPVLNYLNLGNTTKSVTKIIVATGIAHFKHPPKKNTTKPHSHHLPIFPIIIHLFPHFSTPVVHQWHPHATLGLNASSHRCRRCQPTTSTTSQHLSTWRIGGRARPKTSGLPAPAVGGFFVGGEKNVKRRT